MTKKSKISLLIAVVILLTTALIITLHLLTKKPEPLIPEKTEVTEDTYKEEPSEINPQIIGFSVESRKIENYNYGHGSTTLLFVGGIHGGYEWNSVLLAYSFIDKIESGEIKIPEEITIKIIPNLNPDGVYKVTNKEGRFDPKDVEADYKNGEGRFNANEVDLNRNFACKWQPTSTWKNKNVSAGKTAFSEPEAKTLKEFVEKEKPSAVIFWHSQANAVYASECEKGILPNTIKLMDTYAEASGYKAISAFDAYPVTGDAEGWLASIGIPAITVELSSRESIDWIKNKAGVEAVLELYSK